MLSEDCVDLQGDGKDGRGYEDPYQLYLEGASRHGCVQTNSLKYISYICFKIYPILTRLGASDATTGGP